MPYPGRGNQDVMHLVTNGGRLEAVCMHIIYKKRLVDKLNWFINLNFCLKPSNCPAPVHGIMSQCWHPIPEERPNFGTIMERLGYCIQVKGNKFICDMIRKISFDKRNIRGTVRQIENMSYILMETLNLLVYL
jgi:hypothetical protein